MSGRISPMPRIKSTFTPPEPEEIQAFRASLNQTQAAVADALGVDTRTVQKWESGETKISKMAWLALQTLRG